jgi:adenosylcobinamide-phosphate synthase
VIRLRSGRAAGLLLGAALDAALADPRRRHPVAAFGSLAGQAEARLWADSRGRGAAPLAVCLLPGTTAGAIPSPPRP